MIGPDDVIDTAVPADEKFMRATDDGKRAEKKMSTETNVVPTVKRPKLAGRKAPAAKPKPKAKAKPKLAKKAVKKPAARKFTPKGKAKGDARRVAGKWPGGIGVSLEPKLFARLERGRSMVAKREKLKRLSRSAAISRALDGWLKKIGA